MREAKKLTPALEQQILGLAANMTGAAIARKLDLDPSTVNRWLKAHREERGEATKAVARETLAPLVPKDIEGLGVLLDRLESLRRAAATPDDHGFTDPNLELKIIDRQLKVIDTRLHYAGADEGGPPELLILGNPWRENTDG